MALTEDDPSETSPGDVAQPLPHPSASADKKQVDIRDRLLKHH